MIVCHCNVIACTAISRSVRAMASAGEPVVVTPGQVFRCCGARPQCGGCIANVTALITAELEALARSAGPNSQPRQWSERP